MNIIPEIYKYNRINFRRFAKPKDYAINIYSIVTHVLHMDTTIRNIDPFVYKKLKTKAAQEGISIGEAVTKAISEWLGLPKKKRRSIIEIKPEHFGYQYRNLSEEIDEVLYK